MEFQPGIIIPPGLNNTKNGHQVTASYVYLGTDPQEQQVIQGYFFSGVAHTISPQSVQGSLQLGAIRSIQLSGLAVVQGSSSGILWVVAGKQVFAIEIGGVQPTNNVGQPLTAIIPLEIHDSVAVSFIVEGLGTGQISQFNLMVNLFDYKIERLSIH